MLCRKCKIKLSPKNSYVRKRGKRAGQLIGACRKCNHQGYVDWRKNNPIRARARGMLNRYGLDFSTYAQALERQDNRCMVCREKFSKPPQIDHDHTKPSFRLRGLLCHLCNKGLGCFRESVPTLKSAIQYLQKTVNEDVADKDLECRKGFSHASD